MSRGVSLMSVLASVLALTGCPRPAPPPPPPPPPPPIVVPEGCLDDLSGEWTHAEDPTFHYRAEDDGGVLTLTVLRVFPDAGFHPHHFGRDAGVDAGASRPDAGRDAGAPDAGRADAGSRADGGAAAGADGGNASGDGGFGPSLSPRIELYRTPRGFVGRTIAQVLHPSGQTCTTTFATEVLDCRDGGLVLRSEGAVALGDSCEPPSNPQPSATPNQRLIRVVVDAGAAARRPP